MKLIERIENKEKEGFIRRIAENIICQEIILECISKSQYADNVLMKGGVVMFNITKDARRASRDIDFDFIRYDISTNKSIDLFISLLDKHSHYTIRRIGSIDKLKQEDYDGKRLSVEIKDGSYAVQTKIDIGVHTLFAIPQDTIAFTVKGGEESVLIHANPPEQIVAEKLYSLAKHNLKSTRYKDIFDVNYLIQNCSLNKNKVYLAINLLIKYGKSTINDFQDFLVKVDETINDKEWSSRLDSPLQNWSGVSKETSIRNIVDFIYKL